MNKIATFSLLIIGLHFLVSCSSSTTSQADMSNNMISNYSDNEFVQMTKTLEKLALAIDKKLNKGRGRLASNVQASWEEARIEVLRMSTKVEQFSKEWSQDLDSSELQDKNAQTIRNIKRAIDALVKALETYPLSAS